MSTGDEKVLKVLKREIAVYKKFKEAFIAEFKVQSKLQH